MRHRVMWSAQTRLRCVPRAEPAFPEAASGGKAQRRQVAALHRESDCPRVQANSNAMR